MSIQGATGRRLAGVGRRQIRQGERHSFMHFHDFLGLVVRRNDRCAIEACRPERACNWYRRFQKSCSYSAATGEIFGPSFDCDGKMASSPALRRICMRAYEMATSRPASDQPYYQVVRCLTGSSGREHSRVFHFDSYILTCFPLWPLRPPLSHRRLESTARDESPDVAVFVQQAKNAKTLPVFCLISHEVPAPDLARPLSALSALPSTP